MLVSIKGIFGESLKITSENTMQSRRIIFHHFMFRELLFVILKIVDFNKKFWPIYFA